jgi:hypothetical protein
MNSYNEHSLEEKMFWDKVACSSKETFPRTWWGYLLFYDQRELVYADVMRTLIKRFKKSDACFLDIGGEMAGYSATFCLTAIMQQVCAWTCHPC